jgi:DNA mismatch repair ATPase MutS
LLGLRDFVEHYVRGSRFGAVREQSTALLRELGEVRYDLLTRGTKLTVAPYDEEPDYSAEVLASFERFRQGDVKDHRGKITPDNRLNHVEVAVLDMVAQLYPQLFGRLGEFCARHEKFVDRTVSRADRELQFYLGYLDFTDRLRRAGLRVSYPEISTTCKAIAAADTFDIALAAKLVGDGATVVTNDFHLDGAERVLVVSGPNQGGKTTLARTVGQLCHVAALGCPVPGTRTRLFLPDAILTHFEREEDIETLAGKLEEELYRMHAIFDTATGDSVIILNEIFNSTTVQDAAELSQRMLSRISDLDALCVCVTFIDELASLNEKTVSMVSTVAEHDPAVRTYRLVRKPADGRAYALAIAQKYRLTYDALKERLA